MANYFGTLKKNALHSQLGIPSGRKIPVSTLKMAANKPGIEGKRARFALNARKFKHRGLMG